MLKNADDDGSRNGAEQAAQQTQTDHPPAAVWAVQFWPPDGQRCGAICGTEDYTG